MCQGSELHMNVNAVAPFQPVRICILTAFVAVIRPFHEASLLLIKTKEIDHTVFERHATKMSA